MKIILTGPPCAGKTTLLRRLGALIGIATVPEPFRGVFAECVANGRPWSYELIYDRAIDSYRRAPRCAILDRSHIDCIAYGYAPKQLPFIGEGEAVVWYLRFRPDWYRNDPARTETPDEARKIGPKILHAYQSFTRCLLENVDCTMGDDYFAEKLAILIPKGLSY